MKIFFYWDETAFSLRHRKKVKAWLYSVFVDEGKELESLNIIFTTDANLLKINIQHLNHDNYTDIITFGLSDNPIIAEIYISIDRIKENSLLYLIPFKQELFRVMVHGALHLCGYGDKSPEEIIEIRSKEDHYLENIHSALNL